MNTSNLSNARLVYQCRTVYPLKIGAYTSRRSMHIRNCRRISVMITVNELVYTMTVFQIQIRTEHLSSTFLCTVYSKFVPSGNLVYTFCRCNHALYLIHRFVWLNSLQLSLGSSTLLLFFLCHKLKHVACTRVFIYLYRFIWPLVIKANSWSLAGTTSLYNLLPLTWLDRAFGLTL